MSSQQAKEIVANIVKHWERSGFDAKINPNLHRNLHNLVNFVLDTSSKNNIDYKTIDLYSVIDRTLSYEENLQLLSDEFNIPLSQEAVKTRDEVLEQINNLETARNYFPENSEDAKKIVDASDNRILSLKGTNKLLKAKVQQLEQRIQEKNADITKMVERERTYVKRINEYEKKLEALNYVTVKINYAFISFFGADGKTYNLYKGNIVKVPKVDAEDLIRKGYAEPYFHVKEAIEYTDVEVEARKLWGEYKLLMVKGNTVEGAPILAKLGGLRKKLLLNT